MANTRNLTVMSERSPEGCAGCTRTSRRGFLGQLSGATIAAALASERAASGADTLSFTEVLANGADSNERKYPLPASDGITIDREAQVILVRHQGRVYAFALACPHENTALRWRQQDVRFQCPRHESKYQPDGTFISGRATRNMDRFAVRREGDTIVVDLNSWFRSDQQAEQWTAAVVVV